MQLLIYSIITLDGRRKNRMLNAPHKCTPTASTDKVALGKYNK
jgi:hypothetical protein